MELLSLVHYLEIMIFILYGDGQMIFILMSGEKSNDNQMKNKLKMELK